jgi:hypothetical protein
MMLVVKVPWAKRPWALPFLTVLAPSERANDKLHRRHKTLVKWARQMIAQVRRWWPRRRSVLIGDGREAYAAVGRVHFNLGATCRPLATTDRRCGS